MNHTIPFPTVQSTVHKKIFERKKLANLVNCEPFANFLFTNYFQFKSIRWQDFLGLLNYFKCTQKKDRLDTNALPDPDGPLSRDISCSSIGITNTHVHHVSAAGSIK